RRRRRSSTCRPAAEPARAAAAARGTPGDCCIGIREHERAMLRSPWSPAALLLVLLMALGSVVMWIGVPLGLIYLASRVAGSANPSVGPYLLVLGGLPVGMAIVGKLLGWLERLHSRLTGRVHDRR